MVYSEKTNQPLFAALIPNFFSLSLVVLMRDMSKTFTYARMNDGTFPKQIQLGSRSVVWNERDVIDWMNQQIEATT